MGTGGDWWVLVGSGGFGAHVVGRVRGPCCGTCSGSMWWDVFGAHVVGRVQGPCCGTCSGPMLWDMFGAYVVGPHVRIVKKTLGPM